MARDQAAGGCYLIGEDSLLVQCGEILVAADVPNHGVISDRRPLAVAVLTMDGSAR
jgi:hypothetical protein